MLQFKNLLHLPNMLKNRNNSIDMLLPKITMVDKNKEKNGFILNGNIENTVKKSNYNVSINFLDEQIKLSTKIQLYCNCQSFKFEFAKLLNNVESLLNVEQFKDVLIHPQHEKNKFGIITGCKHIICFARLLDKTKHKINLEVKKYV